MGVIPGPRAILNVIRSLLRMRTLIFQLARRDFKTRYLGSYLGVIWGYIQPFISMLLLWFIFEIVAGSPAEIRRLLKNRRIHSFDEVLNPTLPDGRSSVAAVLEGVGLRGGRGFPAWAVWAIVILVLALAFFVIDPLRTGYLGIVLEKIGISWT